MDLLEYVLNMPSLLNFFFLGPHDSIFSRVIRIIGKYAVEVLEKDDSGIKDLLWIEVLVNDLDYLVFRDSMDETAEDVGEKVIADGFLVDDTGADFKLSLLSSHHVAFDISGHGFAETPGTMWVDCEHSA